MEKLCIAENGRSNYHIVTAKNADETVRYAADELHRYLYQTLNCCVPVFSDLCPQRGAEIRIGLNVRDDNLYSALNGYNINDEGFLIKTANGNLYITGASSRGTLYGVYRFLELFCGVRWLTAEATHLPKQNSLFLDEVELVDNPAFEYRDSYWTEAFDGAFCARSRLNSSKADITRRQGGRMKFFNFHHSFLDLVPKEKYFSTHPEYFSEIDGQRVFENTQLCLSNPQVLEISIETVRRWIKENPECQVFSIAQNDWTNYCCCQSCRSLDEKEKSPSASIIKFVNAIAQRLEDEYPHLLFHTFAYQYSIEPPKTIKPRHNVIVRLCNIGSDFALPLELHNAAESYEAKFCNYLKRWAAVCGRLYVWDYATNFAHYLLPFPNLESLQKNIQLYRSIGVKGVLLQGNFSHGGGGAMAELQVYLQAKLMWNPDIDLELEKESFLTMYYGGSAPYISRYLKLLHLAVQGHELHIYDAPNASYFTDKLVEECMRLFDIAEKAADNPDILLRVKKARLSVDYLWLTRLPTDTPDKRELIDNFGQRVRSFRISELWERANLDDTIEVLKCSRYALDNSKRYQLYYRM